MPQGSVFMRFGAEFGQAQVERLRERVAGTLEMGGITGPSAYVLVTVVDELVCNVLEHGHASWVELEMHPGEKAVKLVVRDDGEEFDPVKAIREKSPASALENESERSLGLYMVSQLADSCDYRRLDGKVNELSFNMELKGN